MIVSLLINKHVNALFISCSRPIHHFGLAFNVGDIVDVRQNTFQVIQQKTETDGEIESLIYEQARIYDDDIVAMYNKP